MACIEALRHSEIVIEFFKIIKNGKPLTLKLFVETIIDPSKLTDSEITKFIQSFHNSFFKTNMNFDLKQKITGFLIRMRCSDNFCSKVTNVPLKHFIISPAMNQLYQFLIQFFKPVVLKITTSNKSHCGSQIKNFTNITLNQFELIRSEKLDLNRKMSKFEVWSVKSEYVESTKDIINESINTVFDDGIINHYIDEYQSVTKNHHDIDSIQIDTLYHHDTDSIQIDTVLDDNGETIERMLDYNDLTSFFSSFRG